MVFSWGSPIAVNTTTSGRQVNSSVVGLPDGGFLVTWEDYSSGASHIMAQRFDATGRRAGSEFAVLTADPDNQSNPVLALRSDGGFAIAYEDPFSGSATDIDVKAHVYNPNGTTQTAIATWFASTDKEQEPDVAAAGTGFAAVATDYSLNSGDIVLRRFDSAGGFLSTTAVNDSVTAGVQSHGHVAQLSDGSARLVVAWQNGTNDIRYRIFQADGTTAVTGELIAGSAPAALSPDVVDLANGNFVVVWSENGNPAPSAGTDIFMRIFTADGIALTSEVMVNSTTTGEQLVPQVIALPGGGFAVGWVEQLSQNTVNIQIFDALGNSQGTEFKVTPPWTNFAGASEKTFSMTALADGRIVVTWDITPDSAAEYNIAAQVIDPRDGLISGDLYNGLGVTRNDLLYGNDNLADTITGLSGHDVLYGLGSNDQLDGGAGADRLVGGLGNDRLNGGQDNDILTGGSEKIATWGLFGSPDRLADFNGDGRADILEISANGHGDVWLSGGTRILDSTTWASGLVQGVKFGDFNGDGSVDLLQLPAIAGGAAQIATSTGRADLGFNAFGVWSTGFTANDKVGDFNGDNKDDVIQLGANGNAYVWLSNGTSFNAYSVWGSGVRPSDKIADVNGDGKDDVIQLHENGNAYVWTSTGSSFNPYQVWGSGARPSDQFGDFNGDGRADIIELHENGNAYVWTSTGTNFNPYQVWGFGIRPTDQIGDFNGDGKDDIIQLHENGNAYVWLSNGTSFNPYLVWTSGIRPTDQIGDFNGDGKDDIIELHQNGNAYVWISTGTNFNHYQVWGSGLTVGDGAGDDTFTFTGAYGNDIVTDFQPGAGIHDVLQLDASTWSGFNDVLNHTTDDGLGNTVIAFGGNSITLYHVLKAQLVADDFQFI